MLDMDESFEDQPLGYLLSRVMFALKTDVSETVLDPLEVAFPEYLCMRVLAKFPGQSNADLARALSVSPQAMNMVLRGLEDRRLVTRPAERVVRPIAPTPAQRLREARTC
jgi:DNA-binding MarR family transcriptional regulator